MASSDNDGPTANQTTKRYMHPFTENQRHAAYAHRAAHVRLSAAIREKPEWWVKFRDENVQAKWRNEIREQQKDLRRCLQLTDNMINYIMGELEAYAALRDPETGIEAGPYERIWQSDELIPASLKADLVSAIAPLESVPDSEKDWHPGSDGKVLDLVHPSLYPVVYGHTTAHGAQEPLQPRATDIIPMYRSERFQWLPSDFRVEEDGSVCLVSPYINNIHPEDHEALTAMIPKMLEKAVPMFERVLSDLARETQLPTRLDLQGHKFPQCVWPGEFLDKAPVEHRWPESKPSYTDSLDCVKKTKDLRGRTLQVIVKLANIVLTPEKPEYGGGAWHVEGMDNEAIVSTFIYYYDAENLTESTLSFRNAVNEPRYHGQCDYYCMRGLYDMSADQLCAQNVGYVTTKQDRCIAFPNLYQHLVSPFRLADPTKPGHRKILVFFLVDPNITIPSASTVAPQQERRIRRAAEGSELWWRLPNEWLDPITETQARKYREELMKERSQTEKAWGRDRFALFFNLCEH
ncbi:uncharacterized protein B0H18DRAFT_1097137 [Fomitopsis serialis]|uniref:uncharacterized protein n=1 Tax=Fomitopsis serialis TaxID=139415 RepID=UPI002008BECE|nr:uncharacterized protein B0H18DRAFT_1097137 [Neoantrodia serialis]KAH9914475.1 hypothetical protein B0H18DRAFT_1097137 [Neoantrodia serialis]